MRRGQSEPQIAGPFPGARGMRLLAYSGPEAVDLPASPRTGLRYRFRPGNHRWVDARDLPLLRPLRDRGWLGVVRGDD